jgi:copper chaperone CopZ
MKLKIIGMTCIHCEIFIKKVLSNVPSVARFLSVNRDSGEAIIEGQPDPQVLMAAVRQYEYDAKVENVQHA